MNTDHDRHRALGQYVASQQDPLAQRIHVEALHALSPVPPPSRRLVPRTRWILAGALVCLILGLLLFIPRSQTRPLQPLATTHVVAETWYEANTNLMIYELGRGSVVTAQPSSRFQLIHHDATIAEVQLATGTLDVSIVPRQGQRWRVVAGPYRVTVTGTQFRIAWLPDKHRFHLAMQQGTVHLDSPHGQPQRLVGGDEVLFQHNPSEPSVTAHPPPSPPQPQRYRRVPIPPDVDAQDPPVTHSPAPPSKQPQPTPRPPTSPRRPAEPTPPAKSTPPAKPTPSPKPADWHELSKQGRFDEAFARAQAIGFDHLCQQLDAPTLYQLADTTRYAGHPRDAAHAYRVIRARFPNHTLAARAAFDLGVLTHGRSSIDWFEAYLREQPGGPMARDALGRLLELWIEEGNVLQMRGLVHKARNE